MFHQHDVTSARYLEDGLEAFALPPSPGEAALLKTAERIKKRLAQGGGRLRLTSVEES